MLKPQSSEQGEAQFLLTMHDAKLEDFTQFHGTTYQCQLFSEISKTINSLVSRFSITSSSTPDMRKMAHTALEVALLADSFNRQGALEHAETLIEAAHAWSEAIADYTEAHAQQFRSNSSPIALCNILDPLLVETRKTGAFDNAGLLVDFVKTVSTTSGAAVAATCNQDCTEARMWVDTSKTLAEIYTQALQEARQTPKTETPTQGFPLDLSIEHVMKTQLDNIEAIIMTGDADTCLPVIVNQAEMLKAHIPAAAKE